MEFFVGIAVITVAIVSGAVFAIGITVAFVADAAIFFASIHRTIAAAFAIHGFAVVAVRIMSILFSLHYGKGSESCKA